MTLKLNRLRKRPWTSGFNPENDAARLAAIRWRADRGWKVFHLHDIRILLTIIDRLLAQIAALEGMSHA